MSAFTSLSVGLGRPPLFMLLMRSLKCNLGCQATDKVALVTALPPLSFASVTSPFPEAFSTGCRMVAAGIADGAGSHRKATAALLSAHLSEGIRISFLFRWARQAASLKHSFHALSWHPYLCQVMCEAQQSPNIDMLAVSRPPLPWCWKEGDVQTAHRSVAG